MDALPIPPRRLISEPTRLTIPMTAATHRFHRDLPPSRVWTYEGTCPGPRSRSDAACRSRSAGRTGSTGNVCRSSSRSRRRTRSTGCRSRCAPGRSGGLPDADAAALLRLRGRPPARRDHVRQQRRLDGEPHRAGSIGARHVPERPACGDALVPRPRHGRDAVQRLRRAGRPVDRARRPRTGARAPRGTAVRGAAAARGPQLRPGRGRPSDRAASSTRPIRRSRSASGRSRRSTGRSGRGSTSSRRPTGSASSTARTPGRTASCSLRDGEPRPTLGSSRSGPRAGCSGRRSRCPTQGLVLASAERADLLVDFSDLAPGTELTLLEHRAGALRRRRSPAARRRDADDLERPAPLPRGAAAPGRGRGAATRQPASRACSPTDFEPPAAD